MSQIYQLKISLQESEPLIWRTIQVKSDITFLELHVTIQQAMGWNHSHLFEFRLGDVVIELENEDDDFFDEEDKLNSEVEVLSNHINRKGADFSYIYDLGDNWYHEIKLEAIQEEVKSTKYPVCISGAMNCPPEDCGGVYGFKEKLEILSNESHEEYEETAEWMGENYDSTAFSIESANKQLKEVKSILKEVY